MPNFSEIKVELILIAVVLSYALRIAYEKYIKPKIEGKKLKFSINPEAILKILGDVAKFILYSFAAILAYMTLVAITQMPETTVEVPAKVLFLFVNLVILYTIVLLSFIIRTQQ